MEKLTNKQENVLKELKKYMAKKGYPPTVRELCKATNLNSTATVQTHLNTLVQKGFITKDPEKNRTIELLVPNEYAKKDETVVSVPLLGKVTAGNPIDAIEMPDEYFDLPVNLVANKNDIIIVERKNDAKNGDIVVAMNDDNEVTVKTFYKEKDHFRLQPENDTMEPIILKNVTILGKVVGLYRKF